MEAFPNPIEDRLYFFNKNGFMKQHYLLSLLFLLLFSYSALAQQTGIVTGTVRSAGGEALAGASVQVAGTRAGTLTDNEGGFSLQVPVGRQTLIISYVGYAPLRLAVDVAAGVTLQQSVTLTAAGDLEAVNIVGTRNANRTRIETAVPVDIIPIGQVINEIGQVDLNQIINFIAPSFQSARQTISDGTDHVDPAQLRGLGPDQVLVLVNGKRRHQSALVNVNGTVNRGTVGTDMSAIPATAIERIEILRDGASAQYGSDAIAGVINIVLKKRPGLLESSLSYGLHRTNYEKNYALYQLSGNSADPNVRVTDGETLQASLGYGIPIKRGFLHLTGEYISRQPTNRAGTFTGQIFPSVNGQNRDDSILQADNLSRNVFDMRIGNSEMKGGQLMYNFGYPVSAQSELYLFGGYSRKSGEGAGFYRYPSSVVSGARQYANNVFNIYPLGFLPLIGSDLTDFSSSLGLRTKLGAWNFDVSNTFGQNTFDFNVSNSINYSQFFNAGNAQTEFDAGGLKFWQNTVNADLSRRYEVLQGLNVAAGAEYRIDAFSIRSGEEASYRNYDVNSGAAAGAQVFSGFVNTIGDTRTRSNVAAYVDLEQDFSERFLLTGALRFENYSDFGSTLNYKLSTRYKFGDGLNLRASVSSGFRAPSMQQRFYAKTNTLFVSQGGNLVPIESGTFTNDSRAAQILGIPELQEETSNNYSVGLTARPGRGFELTVDAYQIDIDNRIVLTNNFSGGNNTQLQQQLSDAGASAANFFTNAINTRSRGLEAVLSYNRSFSASKSFRTVLAATFIDNEVRKDAAGRPLIKASDVLVNSGQLGNYFNREDQSRIEVANPKNKISLTFNYRMARFSTLLRLVRFGKVTYLDPGIDPAKPDAFPVNAFTGQRETLDQEFGAKTVTDLSFTYQVTESLAATIGANNLFDVYQDRHLHSGNIGLGRFVYSRRVQQMGFNGAYYFARLKLTLNKGE